VRRCLLRSTSCITDSSSSSSSSNMTAATAEAAVVLARPGLLCVRASYTLVCAWDAAVPCHVMQHTCCVSGLMLPQAAMQLQLPADLQEVRHCSIVSCFMML
jgi:hypothetical protein